MAQRCLQSATYTSTGRPTSLRPLSKAILSWSFPPCSVNEELSKLAKETHTANGASICVAVFIALLSASGIYPSEEVTAGVISFSLLVMFTARNSRREVRLLQKGRRRGRFFYLTNGLLVAIGITVVVSVATHVSRLQTGMARLQALTPAFIIWPIFPAPIYSLRAAALARELNPPTSDDDRSAS